MLLGELMQIKAKKEFGQNFLKDKGVLEKIIQAMSDRKEIIVEIGPGLGDLTQCLLEKNSVIAFEIDSDLCVFLKEKFAKELDEERLILHQGDVIKQWDSESSLISKPYILVANLPYYVATPIVLRALSDPMCHYIEVMVQKEVAEKFSAKSRSKQYCKLSVIAQIFSKVKVLFDIPPEAFEPSPKVFSSVIVFKKEDTTFDALHFRAFYDYLETAFSSPRKLWVKNLNKNYDKAVLIELLNEANISFQVRPHEIDPITHHHLFTKLTKVNKDVKRDKRRE
jgi:16S rRNA (adenine1518-N6/adenine1519-N6)-dimethyltransferase